MSVVAGSFTASGRLQAIIDDLRSADLGNIPDSVVCEQIISLRRQIDQLEAVFSHIVAVAHQRGAAAAGGFLSTAAFLRHAAHLTGGAARVRVDVAGSLEAHPGVAADFGAGLISHSHAAIIVEGPGDIATRYRRRRRARTPRGRS